MKKVSVSTNIAKNLTGGWSIFYFSIFFPDISFVKIDGGKHIHVLVVVTIRLLVQAFLELPSRTHTRAY